MREKKEKADLDSVRGKADDVEEETDKCTPLYGANSQQVEALRRGTEKCGNDIHRYEFAKGYIANMARGI